VVGMWATSHSLQGATLEGSAPNRRLERKCLRINLRERAGSASSAPAGRAVRTTSAQLRAGSAAHVVSRLRTPASAVPTNGVTVAPAALAMTIHAAIATVQQVQVRPFPCTVGASTDEAT